MTKFDVIIEIVKRLSTNDCGYCVTRNRRKDRYRIAISEQAHKTVAEFGSTLLHELLHLWVFILGVYGYKVRLKYEHKFIMAVENTIIQFMYILQQGEPKNSRPKRRKLRRKKK